MCVLNYLTCSRGADWAGAKPYLRAMATSPPEFARLFRLCPCGDDEECQACGGWQLTPRSAAVLWSKLLEFADEAYLDVAAHGNEPVTSGSHWMVFDQFPSITRAQNVTWRRRAAGSFEDLAADLSRGNLPVPRCPAEEWALHLALSQAPDAVTDEWFREATHDVLPTHPEDFDWEFCREVLMPDGDILQLMEPHLDGLEDPDDPVNRSLGMGDYRPTAWFDWFGGAEPRDGRRTHPERPAGT